MSKICACTGSIKVVLFVAMSSITSIQLYAQKFVDPCFTSVKYVGMYYGSDDLVNFCGSCGDNYIGSDLLEWGGTGWYGTRPYTEIDIPPPAGCNIRAIWMGASIWTSGGEGFALRLDKPMEKSKSYTFTFTYASEGKYSDNNFSPSIYTFKDSPSFGGVHYVGELPSVGNSWTTNSITILASDAQDGNNWVLLKAYESSGIFLSNCEVPEVFDNFLVSDTTLCEGGSLELRAIEGREYTYSWNTGSESNSISVSASGLYSLQVKNYKCVNSDSINVNFEDCEVRLVMPNIFTPNGDNFNTLFIPKEYNYIESGNTIILNRWGDEIFSGDLFRGWDGKIKGEEASTGVYYYRIFYTDSKEKTREAKGIVTLVR